MATSAENETVFDLSDRSLEAAMLERLHSQGYSAARRQDFAGGAQVRVVHSAEQLDEVSKLVGDVDPRAVVSPSDSWKRAVGGWLW